LLEGISLEDQNSTFETTFESSFETPFEPTFETTFEPTHKPKFVTTPGEEIYSTEDYFEFYSSSDSAQTLVPRTFSAKESILQDFIVRFFLFFIILYFPCFILQVFKFHYILSIVKFFYCLSIKKQISPTYKHNRK